MGANGFVNEAEQRQALVEHGRQMNAVGINQGKSGNLSVRLADGFLVTPSALAYEIMQPEDIVKMRWDGTYDGKRRPSTEWRLHRDIYLGRQDARAIVHAHAMFATTLACLEMAIPAFHYMVAVAGGSTIPCAAYATFGTQELSDRTVAALDGRKACLMSHHGMVAFPMRCRPPFPGGRSGTLAAVLARASGSAAYRSSAGNGAASRVCDVRKP
jgi:L-fuculose-phosphate aldolase